MQLTGTHLIAGQSTANGTESFQAADPASGAALPTSFTEATPEEVASACNTAAEAFEAYAAISPEARATFLESIADEIMALGDNLIERCGQETALPAGRLTGERGRTVNQLRLFAEVVREGSWRNLRIDTALPNRKPFPRPDIRQMQIPLGPVAIFGASNFPLAFSVAGGDTASALAAGCPVVVKAHPLHPGTSELIGMAIARAVTANGLPPGVFSLLQGKTNAVGAALVQDPHITAVGFTGSLRGGKALYDLAVRREIPIPVFAEMGSVNPVFLLPSALNTGVDQLASGLANSLNLGVGQFCTNPGLVILPAGAAVEAFASALAQKINSCQPGTMLSDGIRKTYLAGIDHLSKHPEVKSLASSSADGERQVGSHVFTTTAHAFLEDTTLEEEIFGPTTLLVHTDGEEDFLRLAQHLNGHLTASLFGSAPELANRQALITTLTRKAGRLIFNAFPTGVEVSHAMVHGGPYPATTAIQSTSVGTAAIRRFSRPVCYQGCPAAALPAALRDENPEGVLRLVNGVWAW
ncbi:MAG: aldehyde dehydrogenase (NADP(+)) [Bacteroidota bacterium]